MSNKSKFVAAVVVLFVTAIVASRQLFFFTVLKGSPGFLNSAGRYHLWFALGAGITASIAGSLMFYFFFRLEGNKWSKVPRAPISTLLNDPGDNPSHNSLSSAPFDAKRWLQLNPWLSQGQADDRTPILGTGSHGTGASSVRRSTARRNYQLNYKKWSQARHD